jgi:hypothetical protein
VAAGSATITIAYSGLTTTVVATITAPTLSSISSSPAGVSINTLATSQLAITAKYSNSTTQAVTSSATFSSSNTAVATVSASGLITAGSTIGSATITVTYSGKTCTVAVSVLCPVVSLTATPASINFAPGWLQPITVQDTLANGTSGTPTSGVTYASSNTGVVTVGSTGVAQAVYYGSATITITYSGIQTTVPVTVASNSNSGSNGTATLYLDNTINIAMLTQLPDGTPFKLSSKATITVSDATILSLNTSSDTVEGIKVGTAVVFINNNGPTYSFNVSILPLL